MKKGLWIGLFAALCMVWPSAALAQSAKKTKKRSAKVVKKRAKTSANKKSASNKRTKKRDTGAAKRELTRLQKSDDGYSYVFRDDPLGGNSSGANTARIKVRQHGARTTLLRPRLHFIPELLKSVEDI
jgi:hypothetical protein